MKRESQPFLDPEDGTEDDDGSLLNSADSTVWKASTAGWESGRNSQRQGARSRAGSAHLKPRMLGVDDDSNAVSASGTNDLPQVTVQSAKVVHIRRRHAMLDGGQHGCILWRGRQESDRAVGGSLIF